MDKLCIIYNYAQLYRQPIFTLIDGEWDCDWWFGEHNAKIKGMDPSVLKKVHFINNKHLIGSIEWQDEIGGLIRRKEFNTFLMLGEPKVLSTWWTLIQRRLFFKSKRVYLWTHGWYGREGFLKKWLKRFFFGMADHIFTYGEFAKEQAIKQGFDGKKITPIHNSLDHIKQVELRNNLKWSEVYSRHFANNYPVLIFIGRLTYSKRLDLLLQAIDHLDKKGHKFNVVLIGEGESMLELSSIVDKLDLKSCVWFYGACYDDKEIARLIYNADLCVSPGSVGLTAMHSMVFGTPVLTHSDFRWQGPEFEAISDGVTGAFFERNNIESLETAIINWFDRDIDREKIRNACFNEIDTKWTPEYSLNILKEQIRFAR